MAGKAADGIVAAILSAGLASWREVQRELSLEEVMDLWEIVQINRWNEHRAAEYGKNKGRR